MRSVASISTSEDHVFELPAKLIKNPSDMKIWERSEAYFEYLGFILAINDAVKGKSNSRGSENASAAVQRVVEMLDSLDTKIDETPPVQQPQRFGNVAFRTWFQKLKENSLTLIKNIVGLELFNSAPEIGSYMIDSFGNSTRIDYGTGHEIAFLMFLCSLFKIGLLKDSDMVAAGCKIFPRYLDLVRKLQITYRMEPAGSHGVWSLDDYQFVPFIWGSSQLFAHPQIEPNGFLQPTILNKFGDDFMFLTCIKYINSVKTGPFAEHSNQLWSISGVSSWSKINGGLIKMYKAEVLSKFPVIQHIVFGSLFTLKPMEQCTGLMSAKTSMVPPPVPFTPSSESSSESSARTTEKSLESKEVEMSAHSSETEISEKSAAPALSQESLRPGGAGSRGSGISGPTSMRSREVSQSQTSGAKSPAASVGTIESGAKGILGEIREPSGYLVEPRTARRTASGFLSHGELSGETGKVDDENKTRRETSKIESRTSAHLGVRQPQHHK